MKFNFGHCSKLTEKNLVKLSLRAKRSNLVLTGRDCFVAALLAMTVIRGSSSAISLQSPILIFILLILFIHVDMNFPKVACVIVTRRLSTVQNADQIMVLSD